VKQVQPAWRGWPWSFDLHATLAEAGPVFKVEILMMTSSSSGKRNAVVQKMEAGGIEPAIIQNFLYYYNQLTAGTTAMISEQEIEPVVNGELLEADKLAGYESAGRAATGRFVRIVLNGGLGTSMGLRGPKSLLRAKNGKSFLEIILEQAAAENGALCLMNSFSTHQETVAELERLQPAMPPMLFLQHKYPKILRSDFSPATWPERPELEWNPPGHGDIYISLHTSGLLEKLLDRGLRYALISNSDNLGASLDLPLLGYFAEKNLPFMMEVARRLPSDAKGGHLAWSRNGGLVLRESAQCPAGDKKAFQDIHRHRYFNTNNIWINLQHLQAVIGREGIVKLPMILNPKTLDPRDEGSPAVYQVETAMGAAISLFEGASAVIVPRSRFCPVKTTNELLALRSDRFVLGEGGRLQPNPRTKTGQVHIQLDPDFYRKIDDFSRRFPDGAPSLLGCESLSVSGDVSFGSNVTIAGSITISNTRSAPAAIPGGAFIEKNISL
jgi:UTP--glucose-1-phosphate uridylyltransferase